MSAELSQRQVGESYKDYAARMAGTARAAEIDRDTARSALAAQRPVVEAARALLEHYPDTEQPIPGGSMWLDDLASTLEELPAALSAPAEAGRPSIEELIDRSSFGTPEAKAARARVSDERVAQILACVAAPAAEATPDDEWCPDECGHAIEDHEDGGCPFCGCAWPITEQGGASATEPAPSRCDVYVRARNVMRAGLRTQEIADGVNVDWWTDSAGVEHVAGVEVLAARGVEVDGLDVVKGRPHGTGPEWTPPPEVAAPDWTAVRPHVQALLAGIDDDASQADATVLGGLAGNLIRALRAGATEPTPDGDSWESITGALVLVGAEQKDTTPGLLALLPIVDRIRALARAGAPAEPTGDTASCGVCKLGGRTLHINDRCPEHGDV